MRPRIGDGGVPNSQASVMQRVRNKNNMADMLMKNEISEFKRQLIVNTMNLNLEMMELRGFAAKLNECNSDDMSEFAPLFSEKHETALMVNNRAKRTRLRDLFTHSELKTPKQRSLYASSPSKSMVRSQTLPVINAVSKVNQEPEPLERTVSTIDIVKSSDKTNTNSSTRKWASMAALPEVPEEPLSRPNTMSRAKKAGIITEIEVVGGGSNTPSRLLPVIQVDSWEIKPNDKQNDASKASVGRSNADNMVVMSRGPQDSTQDMMRAFHDIKKESRRRRRKKKPIKNRIDEFFTELEHLLTVASMKPDGDPDDSTPLPPLIKTNVVLPPIK